MKGTAELTAHPIRTTDPPQATTSRAVEDPPNLHGKRERIRQEILGYWILLASQCVVLIHHELENGKQST